jgi:hypothetical protein
MASLDVPLGATCSSGEVLPASEDRDGGGPRSHVLRPFAMQVFENLTPDAIAHYTICFLSRPQYAVPT